MQSKILKLKMILCVFLTLIFSSCNKNSTLENQITVKINLIDSKTKQLRVNVFDTIDIRVAKFGFPMRRYVKVAEYVTDTKGSVKVRLDSKKEYHFIIGSRLLYGATEFYENELRDGQEINIEVITFERK